MYQHIFWFFGHPEVYIMILPAFGIVSEIIPTFSRKPLFGYQAMVYALASIAFLSFIVWAHHMFAVGMPLGGEIYFMFATMLISVPTGVKIFNWVSTMWKGSLTFETPMLWSLAFVVLFAIRSEEHTSELQSLMRISYAVFCLKKKQIRTTA